MKGRTGGVGGPPSYVELSKYKGEDENRIADRYP